MTVIFWHPLIEWSASPGWPANWSVAGCTKFLISLLHNFPYSTYSPYSDFTYCITFCFALIHHNLILPLYNFLVCTYSPHSGKIPDVWNSGFTLFTKVWCMKVCFHQTLLIHEILMYESLRPLLYYVMDLLLHGRPGCGKCEQPPMT